MASAGQTQPGGQAGGAPRLNPSAVSRVLMEFLAYFGRAALVFYPVYLTGYLGLSVSWVLLCMVMVSWWKKNRRWKDARFGTAVDFVENETHVIDRELRSALQMASWVHFPDAEKVDWMNKVLEQAWPFFGMYMEKLLRENIQPAVRLSSPALRTFAFTKIHFGHVPLRITGIKAYTDEVDQREVVLDMNLSYEGDVDIDVVVKPPVTAGVKGLKLKGMLRVILEPLIGQVPLVGGVTFFFIRRPTLQVNWTGMSNLLDSPAFSSLSEETILDIIASLMVLPNRMCIPLIDQVKVDQMRFPLPRGVVRVHLLEARDLLAKDTYMMGLVKGKSDPYATLRVGNRHFTSRTIKENLHPKWNEVFEFVVHEAPGQELELELFDEDTDKDDLLGTNLSPLQWFPLEGGESGEVHLKLQWLSLNTDSSLLCESTDGRACAMLSVYLDNASNLPVNGFTVVLEMCPSAAVVLSPCNKSDSLSFIPPQVVFASKDPVWEEGFTFFVHNVKTQQLIVQVKAQEKKNPLGVLNLPLSRLVNTSDMTLDQRFQLEQSGANSQIKLKAILRVSSQELTLHIDRPKRITPAAQRSPQKIPLRSDLFPVDMINSQSMRTCKNHQGSFGEIHLTVRYTSLRNKLIILVNACRNLFPCSDKGTDSYVRLYLLPDQTWRHRKKTHVKKRTVNPEFNDKFEFNVPLQEAQTRKLDVAVKNSKMFHSRERKDIGMVVNAARDRPCALIPHTGFQRLFGS
uniref:Extended synaptotagmin-3 n=1 Tax=Scophthalmus maximus TaxID=52904 RepID=A0A8D3DX58_SCOMX